MLLPSIPPCRYREQLAQEVEADRQVIANNKAEALRAARSGNALDYVLVMADAANQTAHALPALFPPTHDGDKWGLCISVLDNCLLHHNICNCYRMVRYFYSDLEM